MKDFDSYRSYLTRRLKKVSKQVKINTTNDLKIQLLILKSERSLFYSKQLFNESVSFPFKRKHAVKRLKKAIKYSNEIVLLTEDQEAKAFYFILGIQLPFECFVFVRTTSI